ncbi:protein-L-isoaspartate O-methyltransferase [Oleiagrimonas sp.]|jgi:protein-L-isoaspartate(D-aspartate) O-methyltransferase|uniref:protein-L-isoaspartate O-methyltransferase family protein n=1 Tax=Oleiagrimonas sp. TaxID=2010330 RepID=UPI00261EA8D0|nr:protein-L-isoaspartate O-methyltransferase [Oleiagrimonas sp.]MDA3914167.1 protein-L-isoaspartate O-methyltransferase [Oleiagrimonas sp.]
MTMNFELARQNMVEYQIRSWEVLDPRVLDVLGRVRREDFVPAAYRNLAFSDMSVPLGHGEEMMRPVLEGRMLQALTLNGSEDVLEIGTGSGFVTGCLATLARRVASVDVHADFTEEASRRLRAAAIDNVELFTDEAVNAYQPGGVFDVVVVTGAVHTIPTRFNRWLKPGGRMFVIRGLSPAMEAVLLHHEGEARFRVESLFETDLPYLQHAEPMRHFTL